MKTGVINVMPAKLEDLIAWLELQEPTMSTERIHGDNWNSMPLLLKWARECYMFDAEVVYRDIIGTKEVIMGCSPTMRNFKIALGEYRRGMIHVSKQWDAFFSKWRYSRLSRRITIEDLINWARESL